LPYYQECRTQSRFDGLVARSYAPVCRRSRLGPRAIFLWFGRKPCHRKSSNRSCINKGRVTHASQMVSQRPIHSSRPASSAGLTRLGQGDQRIYRALHTSEPHRIAALNTYSHRPRRTHNVLSQRVPLARKHEVDPGSFPENCNHGEVLRGPQRKLLTDPRFVVTQFLRLNKTQLLGVGHPFRRKMSWRDKSY
jgi:hypothetical protein